jgi:3-carboxy-cis,cis-muconate cycloisomerase
MSVFASIAVPAELLEAVSEHAWLGAMLDAERALANAECLAGVIPAAAAALIAEQCRSDLYDWTALADQARAAGNPAEPLVRALRAAVGADAADYVHYGATSQDIVDTAAMVVARDALLLVVAELDGVAAGCAALARRHRGTVAAARTLLQQAVPTTFGLRAAGWLVSVLDARAELSRFEPLAQLGGAAGTLAALGEAGPEVLRLYAAEVELAEPALPWHVNRVPVARLGSALELAAGVLAKIGTDVVLLSAFGEVAEASPGGSSTMPHKRNPIGSILARVCELQVRGHASVLAGGLAGELERAAGSWHAEWDALAGALALTGGAAAAIRGVVGALEVHAARMRANIEDSVMSEKAAFADGPLTAAELDPAAYLGSAETFVDRALERYEAGQLTREVRG